MESIQLINPRRHVELTNRKCYKPPQETIITASIPDRESQPLFLNSGFQKINMVVVKNDFHPTKTILVVVGEFKTNVFHFVHWESVETGVGALESVVVIETVVGVIGT